MFFTSIPTNTCPDEFKKEHLKKFDDIDGLLKKAQPMVVMYFELQDEYKSFHDFQDFLKTQLAYYSACFRKTSLPSYENYNCMQDIAKKYSLLVFFQEENPFSQVIDITKKLIENQI